MYDKIHASAGVLDDTDDVQLARSQTCAFERNSMDLEAAYKGTKVLVTGASGFIGGHLTQRLVQSGEQVRCLVRRSSNVELIQPLGVELAYADPQTIGNPRDLTKDSYEQIYRSCFVKGVDN